MTTKLHEVCRRYFSPYSSARSYNEMSIMLTRLVNPQNNPTFIPAFISSGAELLHGYSACYYYYCETTVS